MLKRLGKDIHNPKYICPSDLRGEHNKREVELRRQREREAMERKREKAMADEGHFRELKSKFFGIRFTDGTIQVHVLESEQEYIEEGAELHHCLFLNEYYLKENSLILSATIEGKRIETIEVSLDRYRAVACATKTAHTTTRFSSSFGKITALSPSDFEGVRYS